MQSTVSQQIKRLEFETKCPLFRRTTRSVALTLTGRFLELQQATRVAEQHLPVIRLRSNNWRALVAMRVELFRQTRTNRNNIVKAGCESALDIRIV
jgi:hypothetical protein